MIPQGPKTFIYSQPEFWIGLIMVGVVMVGVLINGETPIDRLTLAEAAATDTSITASIASDLRPADLINAGAMVPASKAGDLAAPVASPMDVSRADATAVESSRLAPVNQAATGISESANRGETIELLDAATSLSAAESLSESPSSVAEVVNSSHEPEIDFRLEDLSPPENLDALSGANRKSVDSETAVDGVESSADLELAAPEVNNAAAGFEQDLGAAGDFDAAATAFNDGSSVVDKGETGVSKTKATEAVPMASLIFLLISCQHGLPRPRIRLTNNQARPNKPIKNPK